MPQIHPNEGKVLKAIFTLSSSGLQIGMLSLCEVSALQALQELSQMFKDGPTEVTKDGYRVVSITIGSRRHMYEFEAGQIF